MPRWCVSLFCDIFHALHDFAINIIIKTQCEIEVDISCQQFMLMSELQNSILKRQVFRFLKII